MLIFWLRKGREWTPKLFRSAKEWNEYQALNELYFEYLEYWIERRAK